MIRDFWLGFRVFGVLMVLVVLVSVGLIGHGAHSGGLGHLLKDLAQVAAAGFSVIQVNRWLRMWKPLVGETGRLDIRSIVIEVAPLISVAEQGGPLYLCGNGECCIQHDHAGHQIQEMRLKVTALLRRRALAVFFCDQCVADGGVNDHCYYPSPDEVTVLEGVLVKDWADGPNPGQSTQEAL